MKTFYFHYFNRYYPMGGYTLAVGTNSVGSICIGVAYCSFKDNFCKKTGREVALRRLYSDEAVSLDSLPELYNFFKTLRHSEKAANRVGHGDYLNSAYYHVRQVLNHKRDMFAAVNFDQEFCTRCLK